MGMWNVPLALFNSETEITIYCTVSEIVGDLYAWLGAPAVANNYSIIVDNCALANIVIDPTFPVGTTFLFTCINDGSLDGLGADGGNGGPLSTNAAVGPGSHAFTGGHAIVSNSFSVSVDVDDGYIRGGGGGGGGAAGSSVDFISPQSAGGGGGGAGFSPTSGGAPGNPSGNPPAMAGGAGGNLGPGVGGAGGAGPDSTNGGDGGDWGLAGKPGDSNTANHLNILSNVSYWLTGGAGGNAGNAFLAIGFDGSQIIFSGAKSEAILRSEGRIRGETSAWVFLSFFGANIENRTETNPTANVPLSFNRDGTTDGVTLIRWGYDQIVGIAPPPVDFGDIYQIRASANLYAAISDLGGGWDTIPAADGTWIPLTSDIDWSFNVDVASPGNQYAGQYFEIQRIGWPTDDAIASGWLTLQNKAP